MSYNLKICLIDCRAGTAETILENDTLLDALYAEISDRIYTKRVNFLGNQLDMVVCWKRLPAELNDIQKHFFGECFTTPVLSDAALYEITRLQLLEAEYKIKQRYPQFKSWRAEFLICCCVEECYNNLLRFET